MYFAFFCSPPTPHSPNQQILYNTCNNLNTSGSKPSEAGCRRAQCSLHSQKCGQAH